MQDSKATFMLLNSDCLNLDNVLSKHGSPSQENVEHQVKELRSQVDETQITKSNWHYRI